MRYFVSVALAFGVLAVLIAVAVAPCPGLTCRNSSFCNETTSQCECDEFFHNSDCSSTKCTENADGPDDKNHCKFKSGWTRILCSRQHQNANLYHKNVITSCRKLIKSFVCVITYVLACPEQF